MTMPERYPEFGQCVHKIVMHPARPERLFLQSHWGLYRSDKCAENWLDIANGLPSDFGFAMITHPRNPDCAYIVPVESDEFRCACEGRLRVYRTRNAGVSWEPLFRGLPQKRAYETVLRDAITADAFDPVGIYFGTRSGQLFGSRDEGRTWQKILEGLPSVVCVRNAVVEDPSGGLGQGCLILRPRLHIQLDLAREARRGERRGDPCRSLFTFRGLCANVPGDAAESRSNPRPQLWPTRSWPSGRFIRAFEIASQRNKGKCENISIFSLGTKMFDIPADSRVPSRRDARFRSLPLSVVAERIPVNRKHREPVSSARNERKQPLTDRRPPLGKMIPSSAIVPGQSEGSGRTR